MDDLSLAADFPQATREQWLKLVEGVLKGADFEKKLVSRTHDGIAIQLDPDGLRRIEDAPAAPLRRAIEEMAGAGAVRYEPYRMGSAFLRAASDGA